MKKNGNSESTVEVVYLDNATTVPQKYNLSVPGCEISCKFSVFKTAVKNMMVVDCKEMKGY